jgi:hypothetical protein
MNREQILKEIEGLSHSKGFYGRLLRDIYELRDNDEEGYEQLMSELEGQNFKDTLEMIIYFEE